MHSRVRPSIYTIVITTMAAMLLAGCSTSTSNITHRGQWKIPVSLPKTFKYIPEYIPEYTPAPIPEKKGKSYVVNGKRYWIKPVAVGYRENGLASWYGEKFHGRLTANQEVYDMHRMTAAHKSLPLPSYIKVLNHNNGKSVTVRVNDRGPFVEGRIVDLSYAAAKKIGMTEAGLVPVTIEVIGAPVSKPKTQVSNLADKRRRGYIQVGSYQEIDNASRVVRLLKEHNLAPILRRTSYRGTTDIHYVRLGPFNTRQELDAVGKLLIRSGFNDYQVLYRF